MSNHSSVDNTTGAYGDIPAPGGAGKTPSPATTPWYRSRTLWVNAAGLLSILLPGVRDWIASNPVEFGAAICAVNTLLKFVSLGKYQLPCVPPASPDATPNIVEDRSHEPTEAQSSSSPGSGTSSRGPSAGASALMLIGGLALLLMSGGCSSSTEGHGPSSVAISEGQIALVHGSSSLVVDKGAGLLLWSQSTPEASLTPPVVQARTK